MKIFAFLSMMILAMQPPSPLSQKTYHESVDARGNISLPADFRSRFSHLGSWFLAEGGASGFHDVYAQPEAVDYFRKNGTFPDGAILVKELRAHDRKTMTTGNAAFANSTIKQWFVMVKDERGRFADSPIWGDGWGWGSSPR